MDRYESYFRSIIHAVKAINSSLEPAAVIAAIVEQTVKGMGVKGSTLRLLDRSGKYLKASASYGLSREYLRKGPVEVEKSQVDQLALGGEIQEIADVCCDPRFQYPEAAKGEQIVSMLVAPLRVQDRTVGVIRVYTADRHSFDDAEKEFLAAIADISAVAIDNARLHQALKVDYEMLMAFETRTFED
jgi:signal transduction protein with GAF and PtsI domain